MTLDFSETVDRFPLAQRPLLRDALAWRDSRPWKSSTDPYDFCVAILEAYSPLSPEEPAHVGRD